MIVTLTGTNSFALQRELQKLSDEFVHEHGDLAVEKIDAEAADPARISEALTALPFLADKKLIILRGAGATKYSSEVTEQLLSNMPETTDVIIVEPKPDKRSTYYKFLKRQTDFRDFPELDHNGLSRWLADEAKRRGGSLSSADARYLTDRVGAKQSALANELDKLLLYKPEISRGTIDMLTESTPQSTIFQLLEAAFAGNRQKMLDLYAEQRAQNVDPVQIIALLAWQLHVLALIKTAGDRGPDAIAKEAKISPYVVKKSQSIAEKLTLAQVKQLVSSLLKIDMQSKRTSLDADEALQYYLLNLTVISS